MFARFVAVAALLICVSLPARCLAQADAEGEFAQLNLSGNVSLPQLVELLARQMDVRFLYSADLANRSVTIYTPSKFPKKSLPILLGSLLKAENLAVVDSDVPGWKRIIDVKDIVPYAKPGDAKEVLAQDGPAAAVTQVIEVKNAEISQLAQILRPFLTQVGQGGSSFIPLPADKMIIVTDYAHNVARIAELIRLIDKPTGQAVIEFYETRNRTPAALIEQAEKLLDNGSDAKKPNSNNVRLFNDASGRRVVVAGDKDRVARTLELLKQLDTGTDFVTKVYRPQNISADRLDKLIRGFVSSEEAESTIESTLDEEGNLLVVRAPQSVHAQVTTLLKELDRPVDTTESPIRFYKLRNANAIEVLYSLLALQQVTGSGQFAQGSLLQQGAFGTLGGLNVGGVTPFGTGIGVQGLGVGLNNIGAVMPGATTADRNIRMPFNDGTDTNTVTGRQNQNQALSPLLQGGIGAGGLGGLPGGQVATLPGGARVSADVATNSLIVYAPANVQPLYKRLIESLDQRRPQVLIEVNIVAVDTSDNYSLGVEVGYGDRAGASRLFNFTSFGLNTVDPTTGTFTPTTGLGFNGVLIDPDVADVIVRALATHTRGRVLASPKILVNDNQNGVLESTVSVPFRSINTINTISTESLGGTQDAGTVINVTPHINEDDHLQLEFSIEFSTFVGTGTADLPPPRQSDNVTSVVTIPDGKTIIVGGLKRTEASDSFSGVPILERIPVLRELTSSQSDTNSTTSFFIFIRPKILRDSRFRDLRYLSNLETQDAELPADFPRSGPLLIPCPNPPCQTPPSPRLTGSMTLHQ